MLYTYLEGHKSNKETGVNKEQYQKNMQLYFLPYKNRTIVYAPYERTVSLLTKKEFGQLNGNNKTNEHPSKEFIKANLYVEKTQQRVYIPTGADLTFQPRELILLMTNLCNARCAYCYANAGELTLAKSVINYDAAMSLIDKYPIKIIAFHGWGEPTLTMPLIRKIVLACKGRDIKFDITTNGLFFEKRKELVNFFIENDIFMTVSYDGTQDITNRQRKTAAYEETAAEIESTIKEIVNRCDADKIKERLGIRITVTELGQNRVPEMVEHLYSLGTRSALIQPLINSGRADVGKSPETRAPKLNEFVDDLLEAYFLGKKIGFDIRSTLLSYCKSPKKDFCTSEILKAVSLTPELNLSSCSEYTTEDSPFIFGKMIKENEKYTIKLNEDKMAKLLDRDNLENPKCKSCPVKCGGGCAKVSWEKYGNIKTPGESKAYCEARQYGLIKYLKQELGLK